MVTKKQLAALARGRAIRIRNLKKKTTKGKYKKGKQCNKTKKKTCFGLGTLGGLILKGGSTLANILGIAYPMIYRINETKNILNGLLGNDESDSIINTEPIRELLSNIYQELVTRDPEQKHQIFKEINNLEEILNIIEERQNKWSKETLEKNIQKMKNLLRKVVSEYKALCRN